MQQVRIQGLVEEIRRAQITVNLADVTVDEQTSVTEILLLLPGGTTRKVTLPTEQYLHGMPDRYPEGR